MSAVRYGIFAKWWGGDYSAAKIGDLFLETLEKLGPVSSVMNHWLIMNYADLVLSPLDEVRDQITSLVSKNAISDDDGRVDPRDGYQLLARGGEVEDMTSGPRSVEVEIQAGSEWVNKASVDLGGRGRMPDLNLINYPLYIEILKVLASTWPCPWIEAHAFAPNFPPLEPWDPLKPPEPIQPRETYYFPWLLYLSAPLVRGWKPPRGLTCDPTPGGGLILSAATERFDPTNLDHVRGARLLDAVVAERLPPAVWLRSEFMAVPQPRIGPY